MHQITRIAATLLIALPATAALAQGAGGGAGQGAVTTGATANGSTSNNLGNPTGQAQAGTSTNAQIGRNGVNASTSLGASGSTSRSSRSSRSDGTPSHPTEKSTGTGDAPQTNSGTSPTGGAAGGK